MDYLLLLPAILFLIIQLTFGYFLIITYRRSSLYAQIWQFVLLSTTFSLWSVVNTSIELPVKNASNLDFFNTINSIGFFLGAVAAVQVYNFAFYYPKRIVRKKYETLFIILLAALTPLALLQVVAGVYQIDSSTNVIDYSVRGGWFPYITAVVLTMVLSVFRMSQSLKDSTSRTKSLKTISLGILFTVFHAVVFAALFPLAFGYQPFLYAIGYLAPVYLVVATSFSMLKQEIYDISALSIRFLLRLFSVASFVAIVSGVLYIVGSWAISHALSIREYLFIYTISLVLVIVFKYFDKKLDAALSEAVSQELYDPQNVLDELNQVLVVDSEIETMLKNVSSLLKRTFKSSYVGFYLRETSYSPYRFIGTDVEVKPTVNLLDQLRQTMSVIDRKIFSVHQDAATVEERLLKELLEDADMEVLCRLVNTTEYKVAGVGYFIIGTRKSGVQYSTNDLKVLEIIANGLVVAVENSLRFEEIEHFNVTLQKKIDAATQELKASNHKLLALDEAKDEFVSLASHQLRTPLTSIKGYLSMVIDGDMGKVTDSQAKMLSQALTSSQRMVYLIGDLLNMSRLKTGKFVIDAKPLFLHDVVASEIDQLRDSATSKDITIAFDKPSSFPLLKLDENKIRQVIMNFIDNAIHYTQPNGKIKIELKNKKEAVEFTVKDTGMGVPKSEQHKLFAQFYRADNARKARPDGTGLGLFMAKKVIIAQGGSIIFDSKEGKGSTFGFSFPKDRLEIVKNTAEKLSKTVYNREH